MSILEINHINPQSLAAPRGYSHAISVEGNYRTIYIGGQNAVNEKGNVVGENSLKEQTIKVLENIEKILMEADAKLEDIVKFNIYLVEGQKPQEGFEAFQQKWRSQKAPVITVVFVAGLGNPNWLVEIEAVAVTPTKHNAKLV
ncbi:MAG: RidA family protein [Candidatus Bathyarchaeota archaeon]|nr:RidA family protein [Candidatus Bathyarchaeota archaeon]